MAERVRCSTSVNIYESDVSPFSVCIRFESRRPSHGDWIVFTCADQMRHIYVCEFAQIIIGWGSLALLGCSAAAAVLAVFMLGADCDKQRAHTHTIALGKNVRFVMTTILLSVVCAVCSEPRVCLHLLDIRYL